MKQCSKCNRQYYDDTQQFCLEDGVPLGDPFDDEATVVSPRGLMDSIRSNKGVAAWKYWTRNEKLTSIGIVVTAFFGFLAVAAWLFPMPAISQTQYEDCELFNDVPTQQSVNVRRNCDKKSCEDDPERFEYPNGTKVRKIDAPMKTEKNFVWIKLALLNDQIVWAAKDKVRCKKV